MHALTRPQNRVLLIVTGVLLAVAGAVAARYALLPLIWHTAAMHFHARPVGMHYHGHPLGRLIAAAKMHYFG